MSDSSPQRLRLKPPQNPGPRTQSLDIPRTSTPTNSMDPPQAPNRRPLANSEPPTPQSNRPHPSVNPTTEALDFSDLLRDAPPPLQAKRRRDDSSDLPRNDAPPPPAKRPRENQRKAPKAGSRPLSSTSDKSKTDFLYGSTLQRKQVENVDYDRLAEMRDRKNEKKEIDPKIVAQYSEAYQQAWFSGKPEKPENIRKQLEAHFFGQEGYLPRCFTCRKSGVSLPEPKAPKNSEIDDFLPCGCEYDDAMLEMWLVRKGLWKKWKQVPKTIGKHRAIMVGFFEMLFGEFSIEKLLNIGNARVDACQRMSAKEDATNSRLSFCEIDN